MPFLIVILAILYYKTIIYDVDRPYMHNLIDLQVGYSYSDSFVCCQFLRIIKINTSVEICTYFQLIFEQFNRNMSHVFYE